MGAGAVGRAILRSGSEEKAMGEEGSVGMWVRITLRSQFGRGEEGLKKRTQIGEGVVLKERGHSRNDVGDLKKQTHLVRFGRTERRI